MPLVNFVYLQRNVCVHNVDVAAATVQNHWRFEAIWYSLNTHKKQKTCSFSIEGLSLSFGWLNTNLILPEIERTWKNIWELARFVSLQMHDHEYHHLSLCCNGTYNSNFVATIWCDFNHIRKCAGIISGKFRVFECFCCWFNQNEWMELASWTWNNRQWHE